MVTPTRQQDRSAALDTLRGLAVIGLALASVTALALPPQALANPSAYGGDGAADRLLWAVSFVFLDDKFAALFAMAFGAGCSIALERSRVRPLRAHVASMAVLFAIGTLHWLVLANHDVLSVLALAGLAVPLLSRLKATELVAVAAGLVVLHCAGGLVYFGSALIDAGAGRSDSDAALYVERRFGSDPAALALALAHGRDTLGEHVLRQLGLFPAHMRAIAAAIPLTLAAMAIGMAGWKSGLLRGEWRIFQLQRLAALCAVSSLPVLLAQAWWVAEAGFPAALSGAAALVFSAPFDLLLAVAYAALAVALLKPGERLADRLAATGRLALTNYIATSVILAALFASWGGALFGEVSRAQAFFLGWLPIAAMLLASPLWLARFGSGPVERVWCWAAVRLS